jgi:hypothetical protein
MSETEAVEHEETPVGGVVLVTPVETTETSETDVSTYKGTEGSKWGKIVVAMEGAGGLEIVDEGREDKGFKSQAQALEAVKKHVALAIDEGLVDMDNIPSFHILRMVKEISPKPIQTTVLDFGEE